MGHSEVRMRVELDVGAGAEAADLEEDTLRLREELLELDIADIERPEAHRVPEGAKGIDAALLGTLIVTTGQEAVGAIVRAIASFVARSAHRSVKLQLGEDVIELTDASRGDQQRLIETFLSRHMTENS